MEGVVKRILQPWRDVCNSSRRKASCDYGIKTWLILLLNYTILHCIDGCLEECNPESSRDDAQAPHHSSTLKVLESRPKFPHLKARALRLGFCQLFQALLSLYLLNCWETVTENKQRARRCFMKCHYLQLCYLFWWDGKERGQKLWARYLLTALWEEL